MNVGNVMRSHRRGRRKNGRGRIAGLRCGNGCALLCGRTGLKGGLTVEIIGRDDGRRLLRSAQAKQCVGGNSVKHGILPFFIMIKRTDDRLLLLQFYVVSTKM